MATEIGNRFDKTEALKYEDKDQCVSACTEQNCTKFTIDRNIRYCRRECQRTCHDNRPEPSKKRKCESIATFAENVGGPNRKQRVAYEVFEDDLQHHRPGLNVVYEEDEDNDDTLLDGIKLQLQQCKDAVKEQRDILAECLTKCQEELQAVNATIVEDYGDLLSVSHQNDQEFDE